MTEKTCNKCCKAKPLAEFHIKRKHPDGLAYICKDCSRLYAEEYNKKNRVKGYWRNRNWRLANPEKANAMCRKYRQKGKRPAQEYDKKRRAVNKLNHEIHAGRITRPSHCSQCNARGLIEGHHEDYSKPLDVIWLCKQCHWKIHFPKPKYEPAQKALQGDSDEAEGD